MEFIFETTGRVAVILGALLYLTEVWKEKDNVDTIKDSINSS